MSVSLELQDLILNTLKAEPAIMSLVNGVWDMPPASRFDAPKEAYIGLGPSDIVEDDAECVTAGEHTVQIDIWSRKPGFPRCKEITDLAKKALHRKDLALATNALVEIRVSSVRFLRDPDGLTSHGILTVTAMIEEPA